MKNLVFLLITLFLSQLVYSKSWRVNNNPEISADFRTLTDAHTASTAGDTIYLEPTLTSYDGFTWSKKLVLIGTGYFLSENSLDRNTTLVSKVSGDIIFAPGSEGSEITGIWIKESTLVIKTGNLVIRRNLIGAISIPFQKDAYLNNIYIMQNYMYSFYGGNSYSSPFYVDGLIFSNNIVVNNMDFSYKVANGSYYCALYAICTNNVFMENVYLRSSIFRNNVFCSSTISLGFLEYSYQNTVDENIFVRVLPWTNTDTYELNLSNIDNVNSASLFVGGSSPDGQWQISSDCPVTIKEKCGIFNGETPYVISGIPNIPVIYYLDMPHTVNKSKGLDVTVKARSNQ